MNDRSLWDDVLTIVPPRRPFSAHRFQLRPLLRADRSTRYALRCALGLGLATAGFALPQDALAVPEPAAPPWNQRWHGGAEEGPENRRELQGKMLPSLVRVRDLRVAFESGAFEISGRHYDGTVVLKVSGILVHPFQSTIHDAQIHLAFLPQGKLEPTWRLLRASPLELTDQELAQKFPRPWLSWQRPAYSKRTVAPNEEADVLLETAYDQLLLDLHRLPEFMGMISSYQLEDPSTSDLLKIIKEGGVVDHCAAAEWAKSSELDYTRFDPESRKEVMDAIIEDLRRTRAPLAHGDLMRLHAMMSLTRIFASPADLEPLLQLEHSMDVLLTSVSLSYYEAVDDENWIDLPVHSIRRVPSLLEYLGAYNTALDNIRRVSFPRLLELAFDPLDFRDAPKDGELKEVKVQKQAKKLLSPLQPTDVNGLIQASDQDLELQREIWKFYIKANYAPAVVPMMFWLQEHPYELDAVGIPAAQSLGKTIVPSILSHYFEPKSPHMRQVARDMLLALPADAVEDVLRAIRGFGILLSRQSTLTNALEAFEAREKMIHRRQADHLEQATLGPEAADNSLSRRMRDLEQLGQLDPKRLEARSGDIINLLAKAALDLSEVSLSESKRAMRLMEDLPLGQASLSALEELAMVKARIAYKQKDLEKAREALIDFDPTLQNLAIRRMYGNLSQEWAQSSIEAGQYAQAAVTIAQAKNVLPDDPRFEILENDLYFAKNRIGLALASLVGLIVVVSAAALIAKFLAALGRRLVALRRRKTPAANFQSAPSVASLGVSQEMGHAEHFQVRPAAAEDDFIEHGAANSRPDDGASGDEYDAQVLAENAELSEIDEQEPDRKYQISKTPPEELPQIDGEEDQSENEKEEDNKIKTQQKPGDVANPAAKTPSPASASETKAERDATEAEESAIPAIEENLDDEFDRMLEAQTVPPQQKPAPGEPAESNLDAEGSKTPEDPEVLQTIPDPESLDFEDAAGLAPHKAAAPQSPAITPPGSAPNPSDDALEFEGEEPPRDGKDKDKNKQAA